MKILVTSIAYIDLKLLRDSGHDVVVFNEVEPVPEEHRDAAAVVLWGGGGNGDPAAVAKMATYMPRLRWVQSLAAGPDALLAAGFAPQVAITGGKHFHDTTVAEHALALTLACVRRLRDCEDARRDHRWASEYGGAQPLQPEDRLTTLRCARTLVWGFGAIGQTTARLLTAFGAQVRGVAQSAGTRAGYEVLAVEDIDAALPETDLLVMVLPATPATAGALSAERIGLLPHRAMVVNVGRGTTIDQEALVAALNAGKLAGAGLDVANPEPLRDGGRHRATAQGWPGAGSAPFYCWMTACAGRAR